jgi:hypothetical protein
MMKIGHHDGAVMVTLLRVTEYVTMTRMSHAFTQADTSSCYRTSSSTTSLEAVLSSLPLCCNEYTSQQAVEDNSADQ